jgi:PAS domain S-box-containing protein
MPIVGRKCHEAYHGRTEPCEQCPSLETLQTGKPSFKIFSRLLNNSEVWLELSTYPLFDSKKSRIMGVIEYTRDVTERKRADEALRESEERFHLVFAQNGDAIILVRMDSFAIIDANQAAEELTGYTMKELLELTPSSFIDPEDFRRLIDTIPIDGYSRSFQLDRATSTRKDDSTMFVSIRGKILRLRDEYIIHCSIRDITEKLHLEEEIRATQAKLIQTNKMTSLGMLSSSVAHEINNPNNCISVNASMLTEVWRDTEQILRHFHEENGEFNLRGVPYSKMQEMVPRLFHGISEGSRRITAIVDNMKDFVREDKSGLHVELDINKLIRSAASILWHHIHKCTDNFQMVLQDDLLPARGNGQQIEQVIINLLMNALQALADKKCSVCIMTSCDRIAGEIIITVRDEGEGMSKDVVAHLREPFFTTKLDKGGTGLGLYISDSIIKEHRGALDFASIPGKGTVATVQLPAA